MGEYLICQLPLTISSMRRSPQTGDQATLIRQFDEWLSAHRHRLLAFARLHADAQTDVDLLLTDTLRKVARVYCRRRMNDELMLRYAMRCLRNAARDAHRSNLRRRKLESRYSEEQQQAAAPTAQKELHAALREVLRELPEPYGRVIAMKMWQQMTFVAIAQQLGVAESTVRRYYESAIELVRIRMKTQ